MFLIAFYSFCADSRTIGRGVNQAIFVFTFFKLLPYLIVDSFPADTIFIVSSPWKTFISVKYSWKGKPKEWIYNDEF